MSVASVSDAELAARSDRLAELLDLKERLADGSLERELSEVSRQQLVREQRARTEKQVAAREFEETAVKYERARRETFDAIRAYVDAIERARRLRTTVNAERRRCVALGVSETELKAPEPTQVLTPRNPEWRELLNALRVANSSDF